MPQIAAWMDEAVGAALKDDEQVIDRIAGEVRDLLAGFPMAGWSEPAAPALVHDPFSVLSPDRGERSERLRHLQRAVLSLGERCSDNLCP